MTSQDEIIAFLSNGASYGLPGAEVERVETHGCIVFLVGDRAYKLKRPVVFSSLDYSTIDRREAACRAELELNRRTAPELYLGVHALRRKGDGELGFDGDGVVIDWVVAMRRFDQADLFNRLADSRALTPERINALAEEIAQFHGTAERLFGFGGGEGLHFAIERNRCDQHSVEAILEHDAVEVLHKASCEALERVTPLLDRRREAGKVRRCHGDLRLANICLLDDRPTLFDAIEFSDPVSCVDVLFDLAFLLMDLHQRGLNVLANMLCNRYLDLTGDSDGLTVLPLMLSVRAATRAYALAGSVQRQPNASAAQHHAAAARAHLTLALSLLSGFQTRVIAIGGIGGSSKTSLASSLAATFGPAPGARILGSETMRKRVLNLPPETRLPASAYTQEMSERVYAGLAAEAVKTVQAGFTAIIDAGFVHPAERQAIAAMAATALVPFIGVWLGSPQDLQAGETEYVRGWHAIQRGVELATILATVRLLVHGPPFVQGSSSRPQAPPKNRTNNRSGLPVCRLPGTALKETPT